MDKRIITLCYRKIIRADATSAWDKMVHEDSFMEFRIQAQNFSAGTNYTSYAELLRHAPDAQQLPARVAPAVTGYVQQLGGVIPDILNTLGRRFLKISSFQFEIINSDIDDAAKHVVAINFFSELLVWHDTVNNYLLVSALNAVAEDGVVNTELFQLQPYLAIQTLKEI
ncbi:hypothetical protein [Mucilaginibacter myungsuensis]|uniref:Uncharacterized protein n=1 Tax=Mucilaginibacter myungsuensis TaxID=649104 RepID=A0A929PWG9_9SPHI|nr:hypothetical protein [Mucilaginibacter myungsuensis]MBE9662823.1 hypothetical protein [Mucilaginibacter myungsuensis]MDN3598243.1 hypothetical protein [Mucilaginibacter myungsuensis]